jgi:hypothetical protein
MMDLALPRLCVQASADAYLLGDACPGQSVCSPWARAIVLNGRWQMADGKAATVISFRGSADAQDWLTDFQIRFADIALGKVHSGFWRSVGSVIDRIEAAVDSRAPLVITGHSKGGAEAVLAAWLLARMGRSIVAVHTFGGPRVGNAAWKSAYNAQPANTRLADGGPAALGDVTTRWVHEEDIVPRMPPWIARYRHIGHEAFMTAFGGVEMDAPVLIMAVSDIWGTFWGYKAGHIEQIGDHPVSKYREHLAQLGDSQSTIANSQG